MEVVSQEVSNVTAAEQEVSAVSAVETQEVTAPAAEPAEAAAAKGPSFIQKVAPLAKNISFYIGALAMFFVGVFYMLMSDLTFYNTSDRLIISVLLSFGSAILFFLSASFNEKPKIMYLFKGLALAMAVGFIIYVHLFQTSSYYLEVLEKFKKAGIKQAKKLAASQATMVITLIFGYLSFVAQGVNTILVATVKED